MTLMRGTIRRKGSPRRRSGSRPLAGDEHGGTLAGASSLLCPAAPVLTAVGMFRVGCKFLCAFCVGMLFFGPSQPPTRWLVFPGRRPLSFFLALLEAGRAAVALRCLTRHQPRV